MAQRKRAHPIQTRARARDLPGLEERHITEIVEAAHEYADARDRRMEIGKTEQTIKTQIVALMHKHKKTRYKADGIEILLEPTDEKLTVRVKAHSDAGDEPDDDEERAGA